MVERKNRSNGSNSRPDEPGGAAVGDIREHDEPRALIRAHELAHGRLEAALENACGQIEHDDAARARGDERRVADVVLARHEHRRTEQEREAAREDARRIVVRLPEWRSRPGSLAGMARGRSVRRRMTLPDLRRRVPSSPRSPARAETSPAPALGSRSHPRPRRARRPAPRAPRAARRPRDAGSPTRPAPARVQRRLRSASRPLGARRAR